MPIDDGQRASFFPKADAAVLQSEYAPPTVRPDTVGPVLDVEHADQAIHSWSQEVKDVVYPPKVHAFEPAKIPDRPMCFADRYLYPMLTENERLRLTMLWYYTRGILEDGELLSRLQEKVYLAQETIGWEFVIVGLLDHNSYTRIVTVGLPLAVLPRRESTCAHTVNQPPGSIFLLPNMVNDWRFEGSPHVEHGGLRAYAGVPLRLKTERGDYVALGTLCVASNTMEEVLSKAQQMSLARLADWVVADIVYSARARRQQERRRMLELIYKTQKHCDNDGPDSEDAVLGILKTIYPSATIELQISQHQEITVEGRESFPISALDHGLWEDSEYLDYFVENLNHQDVTPSRPIRIVAAACQNYNEPRFLVIASKDFRLVFDDVDSWFVHTCALMISQGRQNQLLREALQARENFLRGITHQLRTPIHGILGSAELLAEELKSRNLVDDSYSNGTSPATTPDLEQNNPFLYINTIRASAKDLVSTVNSIIKLNKWAEIATSKGVDTFYHITQIEAELFNEVFQANSDDPLGGPSIFFIHDLPPGCDSLMIDSTLLKECILPLIMNAIQSTTTGSRNGIVTVTISVREDYQALNIELRDNGYGIHRKDQERIFEAYEKLDIHTTGAGLGLTLASKVAKLLNGSISLVSSEVGKGSHFRATFKEPPCACSLHPPKLLKETLSHLSQSFHRIASSPDASLLNDYFTKYLINCGFAPSSTSKDSFLLLDHTSELEQRQIVLSSVGSEQVAICLVPASGCSAIFQQVRRDNNVVYAQGPFLPSTLDEALQEANSILIELAQIKAKPSLDVIAVEATETTPVMDNPPDNTKVGALEEREPLATAVQSLHLDSNSIVTVTGAHTIPSKLSALLVDDNAINLRIMQMYCSKRNISYGCAVDGAQAVTIFSKHQSSAFSSALDTIDTDTANNSSPKLDSDPIGLILMDLQMPVCDGIDACRQIRQLEKENGWKRCAICIVTGQDSPSDRKSAKEAGADGFFVKPVGPKVLDRGVRQFFPDFDAP